MADKLLDACSASQELPDYLSMPLFLSEEFLKVFKFQLNYFAN